MENVRDIYILVRKQNKRKSLLQKHGTVYYKRDSLLQKRDILLKTGQFTTKRDILLHNGTVYYKTGQFTAKRDSLLPKRESLLQRDSLLQEPDMDGRKTERLLLEK
jgi:predicted unusual protein kinase regulating ubiquinone biosynthesis (AarF/ABC1/UbiB family)